MAALRVSLDERVRDAPLSFGQFRAKAGTARVYCTEHAARMVVNVWNDARALSREGARNVLAPSLTRAAPSYVALRAPVRRCCGFCGAFVGFAEAPTEHVDGPVRDGRGCLARATPHSRAMWSRGCAVVLCCAVLCFSARVWEGRPACPGRGEVDRRLRPAKRRGGPPSGLGVETDATNPPRGSHLPFVASFPLAPRTGGLPDG